MRACEARSGQAETVVVLLRRVAIQAQFFEGAIDLLTVETDGYARVGGTWRGCEFEYFRELAELV